ncbi:hypothetical protein [Cohaesibacter gelatinilyticus]|uniref:Uncharacterized protein n=1 Tax=Cohaesibacter gelatinilyticus TaxID=372072 RepID=A0A285NE58_9HYPH|nr:hypothetical protein [Cohaesibacter gelatinilyticus]SNZ07730.1 hypothetical protein SAMN06265368_1241 [Cohaesibacter gelatinilyticus]HAT86121.1 hypothetical protein [Hyphomicrobiales bacterium]
MSSLKNLAIVAVLGFLAYTFFFSPKSEQTADLGQVLDRTMFAIEKYENHAQKLNATKLTDDNMAEFGNFLAQVMNSNPRFYDEELGIKLRKDAAFQGFADKNKNGTQEEGEGDVFTVEIDSENKRIIASDGNGASSDTRFSGSGLLTGLLIGHLLSRQRSAGVKPGSFNNRQTTPRSSYRAPSSARSGARSGGLGSGK